MLLGILNNKLQIHIVSYNSTQTSRKAFMETIKLLKNIEVVYASWDGPITGEQRHVFRDRIMNFCEDHGTTKFIVDLRKQSTGTNIKDNYDFGRTLRRKMGGYTIAAVYKRGGVIENLLTETVQRGDVNLKVFYSLEEAKSWISIQ